MTANPFNLKDGERLPCVGGPLDGALAGVSVIFPFLNGGATSSLFRTADKKHWYQLDAERRRWTYAGVNGKEVIS